MTVEGKSLSFSVFASHIGEELFVCLAGFSDFLFGCLDFLQAIMNRNLCFIAKRTRGIRDCI